MALNHEFYTPLPVIEEYIRVTEDNLVELAAAITTFSGDPAVADATGIEYDYTVPGAGVPIPGRLELGDYIRVWQDGGIYGPKRTDADLEWYQPASSAATYMLSYGEES